MPKITLASASPRRRDLLTRCGLDLDVRPPDVDERQIEGEAPRAMAIRLARDKAAEVAVTLAEPAIVVAADTIVVLDGEVLGKPADEADARAMLRRLSGRTHTVITGFAVHGALGMTADAVETDVTFRHLSDDLIAWYVATGEPLDKAGSYGIQEIGVMLVAEIQGSYTNVVGLPLVEVLDAIAAQGGPRR